MEEVKEKKTWWQQMSGIAQWELICTIIFMAACWLPWLYTMLDGKSLWEFQPVKFMGKEGIGLFYTFCIINIILLIKRRISWISLIIFGMMIITIVISKRTADELAFTIDFFSGLAGRTYNGSIAIINLGYLLIIPLLFMLGTLVLGWFKSASDVFKHVDTNATRHFYQFGIGFMLSFIVGMAVYHHFRHVADMDDYLRRIKNLSYSYICLTVTSYVLLLMSFCHFCQALIVLLLKRISKNGNVPSTTISTLEKEKETSHAVLDVKPTNKELWYVGGAVLLVAILLGAYILLFSHSNASTKVQDSGNGISSEEIAYNQEMEDPAKFITGFHFEVEREGDDNVLFAVNEHGKFNTGFSMLAGGSPFIRILDQDDYDGDGEMEAFVHEWGGGNSVEAPYIVYYDKVAQAFKKAEGFEPMEEVNFDIMHENGHAFIIIKEGVSRAYYVFFDHQVACSAIQLTIDTSDSFATFSVEDVFGYATTDESLEEEEKAIDMDIDGDGEEETLSFYHDGSHALDFGKSMQLNMIGKGDGTLKPVSVTGSSITFLRSTTKGMPDLLVSEKWIYQWDGEEYKIHE